MMQYPRGVVPVQWKQANTCPFGCDPNMAIVASPGTTNSDKRTRSRCIHCLAYWITDTTGKVVQLKGMVQFEFCPDCRRPFVGDPGPGPHPCNNPGHVASTLLR